MLRAKYKVEAVTQMPDTASVVLKPVNDGTEDNADFFHGTPAGSLELKSVNKDTARSFLPGKEYYVDFHLTGIEDPT